MRSFDRLSTGLSRILPAAALLAALFVPLFSASADDGCPAGGCPLPPPQSREINPAPARADGSLVEVEAAGGLPPVEITVHMLAPAFVDPAPLGASFEAIAVPVRYQEPGDVSCGVQALGMALDALPGAAPTSSAMLSLLQDNGMMYDFGTGVEELAYAAQSFGYAGSFPFHGASIGQLQAQLTTGSPVVVSLGANGEAAPGHFVTVTGISSDGRSVAFNDPTLGEQVLSAAEFERLWGLQGNSGVAVAAEPPPAAGADPGMLALWVAFAAGLMALISTTPLAKLRQGIGGRFEAGPGSYTYSRSAPKPAPRSDPPDKEKEKKPKKKSARFDDEIVVPPPTPKASKPRFDDEPPPPPRPTSSVVVTPTEQKAATVAPAKARTYPAARFDEEEVEKPKKRAKAVATPSEQRASATVTPSSSSQQGGSQGVSYTPTAATQATPLLTLTPGGQAYSDRVSINLPPLPDEYQQYLPTPTLPEWDYRTPSVEWGILEVGTQDAFHAGVPANPDLRLTPTKLAHNFGPATVKIGWALSTIEVAIRTPAREYDVDGLGTTAKVQQSGSLALTLSGWNTTTRAAYNSVDYSLSGPSDREAIYGSGNHGVYVEEKPVQDLAVLALAGAALTIGALVFAGSGGMVGNLGTGLENVLAH